jgi:hypothetical protein
MRALLIAAASAAFLGLSMSGAQAGCLDAQVENPVSQHYNLSVDNECDTPVVLAVCWAWPSGTQRTDFHLSVTGSTNLMGPIVPVGETASANWQYCSTGECTASCDESPDTQRASSEPQEAPPATNWGAMAAGVESGFFSPARVAIGWAARTDRSEAEQAALEGCRSRGVANCEVVDAFNKGCGYITTGTNDNGEAGWGSGASSNRALAVCQNRGLDCETPIGGCVDE